jgi:hypothetical protein
VLVRDGRHPRRPAADRLFEAVCLLTVVVGLAWFVRRLNQGWVATALLWIFAIKWMLILVLDLQPSSPRDV